MSESNIWLEQRLAEVRSMRLEITALETLADGTAVIRGPGVCGRPGYRRPSAFSASFASTTARSPAFAARSPEASSAKGSPGTPAGSHSRRQQANRQTQKPTLPGPRLKAQATARTDIN